MPHSECRRQVLLGIALLIPTLFPAVVMRGEAFALIRDLPGEIAAETGTVAYGCGYLLLAFALSLPLAGIYLVVSALRKPAD